VQQLQIAGSKKNYLQIKHLQTEKAKKIPAQISLYRVFDPTEFGRRD
jgi:hypothetical protein